MKFQKLSLDEIKKRIPPYLTIDESTYRATNIKAKFIDSEYGEWWALPYAVFRGQDHPARGRVKNSKSKTMSLEELKSRLPEHLSVVESTYTNASQPCFFIDKDFGQFKARPTQILQGKKQHPERRKLEYIHPKQKMYIDGMTAKDWCKKYNLPYSTLKGIWHLGESFVQSWKENYNTSRSKLEIFVSERLGIDPYNKFPVKELKHKPDFKLGDKVYLNVDGLYWHSEEKVGKKYHYNLRQEFERFGFRLMQFTADQILFKWPIVHSIINSVMGKNRVIFARKCSVAEIPGSDAKAFLSENHIMGYSKHRCIGLMYEGKIVAAMSYSYTKDSVIKIERYCSMVGTNVIGGFSKLLSHLIDRLNPRKVQSWVDLRYGTGDSLKKLGFKHIKTTLGWKWTDGINTFNRLRCRANMDERRLSEKEHAKELGWYRIYDAGQALFELER